MQSAESRKDNNMYSNKKIISSILRLSKDSHIIVSVQDAASDDIVPSACVIEKGSFSVGDAFSSAVKYDQLKHVISTAEKMSSPCLSVISYKENAEKVSYCMLDSVAPSEIGWRQMMRRKTKKAIVDSVAALRLWLVYPYLHYMTAENILALSK